jgi:cellulose synthase/poly-beta-1,6-N-acetylglucosamine synthase-like glycosyltransferase
MGALVFVLIALCTSYTLAIFVMSRRARVMPVRAPEELFFVFVLPCLNEEVVIGKSLDRLLAIEGRDFAILVVDDGSDDSTPDIVRSYDPERVWLLRRELPEARKGKGEALNHAYRYLRDSGILGDRRPEDVVIGIIDADGRLAANALTEVAPYFADPKAGGVQIGVRMYNAEEKMLTRMQDFEFVTFTEVFQRGRQKVGSVGLGGNGQFTRLRALEALGDAPWTDCLTEDLDLGIRLLVNGWTNHFCPTTHVSQQAVTSTKRLIRQRSRWFQGHLQCWKRVPMVMTSDLPGRQKSDMVYHLLAPSLVLMMSFATVGVLSALALAAVIAPVELIHTMTANHGAAFLLWYILSFGLTPFYGSAYWLVDRKTGLFRSIAYAHVFSVYSYMWIPAGWMAVFRIVTGKRSWAKTTRTPEVVVDIRDGVEPSITIRDATSTVVDLTDSTDRRDSAVVDLTAGHASEPLAQVS